MGKSKANKQPLVPPSPSVSSVAPSVVSGVISKKPCFTCWITKPITDFSPSEAELPVGRARCLACCQGIRTPIPHYGVPVQARYHGAGGVPPYPASSSSAIFPTIESASTALPPTADASQLHLQSATTALAASASSQYQTPQPSASARQSAVPSGQSPASSPQPPTATAPAPGAATAQQNTAASTGLPRRGREVFIVDDESFAAALQQPLPPARPGANPTVACGSTHWSTVGGTMPPQPTIATIVAGLDLDASPPHGAHRRAVGTVVPPTATAALVAAQPAIMELLTQVCAVGAAAPTQVIARVSLGAMAKRAEAIINAVSGCEYPTADGGFARFAKPLPPDASGQVSLQSVGPAIPRSAAAVAAAAAAAAAGGAQSVISVPDTAGGVYDAAAAAAMGSYSSQASAAAAGPRGVTAVHTSSADGAPARQAPQQKAAATAQQEVPIVPTPPRDAATIAAATAASRGGVASTYEALRLLGAPSESSYAHATFARTLSIADILRSLSVSTPPQPHGLVPVRLPVAYAARECLALRRAWADGLKGLRSGVTAALHSAGGGVGYGDGAVLATSGGSGAQQIGCAGSVWVLDAQVGLGVAVAIALRESSRVATDDDDGPTQHSVSTPPPALGPGGSGVVVLPTGSTTGASGSDSSATVISSSLDDAGAAPAARGSDTAARVVATAAPVVAFANGPAGGATVRALCAFLAKGHTADDWVDESTYVTAIRDAEEAQVIAAADAAAATSAGTAADAAGGAEARHSALAGIAVRATTLSNPSLCDAIIASYPPAAQPAVRGWLMGGPTAAGAYPTASRADTGRLGRVAYSVLIPEGNVWVGSSDAPAVVIGISSGGDVVAADVIDGGNAVGVDDDAATGASVLPDVAVWVVVSATRARDVPSAAVRPSPALTSYLWRYGGGRFMRPSVVMAAPVATLTTARVPTLAVLPVAADLAIVADAHRAVPVPAGFRVTASAAADMPLSGIVMCEWVDERQRDGSAAGKSPIAVQTSSVTDAGAGVIGSAMEVCAHSFIGSATQSRNSLAGMLMGAGVAAGAMASSVLRSTFPTDQLYRGDLSCAVTLPLCGLTAGRGAVDHIVLFEEVTFVPGGAPTCPPVCTYIPLASPSLGDAPWAAGPDVNLLIDLDFRAPAVKYLSERDIEATFSIRGIDPQRRTWHHPLW